MAHQAYLSLGSNIQPEVNLPRAIELLRSYGTILALSNAWESKAVGSDGPNFLNACALFSTPLLQEDLKDQVIHPAELKLGRMRTEDKYASRTIDIDIIIYDQRSCHDKFWKQAFVVVPLAEIFPTFVNPLTQEHILETATRLKEQVWLEVRPEVLRHLNPNRFRT